MRTHITREYERLIRDEIRILGKCGGPLFLVSNPPENTCPIRDNHGTSSNFTEDWRDMPPGLKGIAVHRYPNRLLVFASNRCFRRCGYCCRPTIEQATGRSFLTDRNIDRIGAYLTRHVEIEELILSGGDPLICPDDILEHAFERFSKETDIPLFRIHTRSVVYEPGRVTPRLTRILARHDVRVILHVVHPYELRAETVDAILHFKREGISVFNQFPILRGINDHPDVMESVLRILADMGVLTSSIYIPEPMGSCSGYRVSLARVYRMTDSLKDALPSWMSSFNVCLDTPIGKVRRNHIISRDEAGNSYLFERNLKRFVYRDIPPSKDVPSNREILLYRDAKTGPTRIPGPCNLE